jgi:hypothetical protein
MMMAAVVVDNGNRGGRRNNVHTPLSRQAVNQSVFPGK